MPRGVRKKPEEKTEGSLMPFWVVQTPHNCTLDSESTVELGVVEVNGVLICSKPFRIGMYAEAERVTGPIVKAPAARYKAIVFPAAEEDQKETEVVE